MIEQTQPSCQGEYVSRTERDFTVRRRRFLTDQRPLARAIGIIQPGLAVDWRVGCTFITTRVWGARQGLLAGHGWRRCAVHPQRPAVVALRIGN